MKPLLLRPPVMRMPDDIALRASRPAASSIARASKPRLARPAGRSSTSASGPCATFSPPSQSSPTAPRAIAPSSSRVIWPEANVCYPPLSDISWVRFQDDRRRSGYRRRAHFRYRPSLCKNVGVPFFAEGFSDDYTSTARTMRRRAENRLSAEENTRKFFQLRVFTQPRPVADPFLLSSWTRLGAIRDPGAGVLRGARGSRRSASLRPG